VGHDSRLYGDDKSAHTEGASPNMWKVRVNNKGRLHSPLSKLLGAIYSYN
jgi:hypothetical protein